MTISDHKLLYQNFLKGHEGKLHFAAHSHHFWPDVSREGHLAYWEHAARTSDEKWDEIFSEVIPKAQKHIARILHLKDHEQIAFAPNTHELAARVLSLFLGKKDLSVVTTTNEFHSWKRQISRLMELPEISVKLVSTEKVFTQREKVLEELKASLKEGPDLFFLSQVFFDSGFAWTDEELLELANVCPPHTVMVIDGYHAFCALPTDLSHLEGKIFYLAGGYKYAQAGEGACFLVVPKGDWRPAYTGWFAEFGELSKPKGGNVGYTKNAMAFMGSTQDPSGLYRFNAVWDFFHKENLTVERIHDFVKTLQRAFLDQLPPSFTKGFHLKPLFQDLSWHGHFLTFEARSEEEAKNVVEKLREHQILIDRRGTRLRFGFGLYQNMNDVMELIRRLGILASR